MRKQIVYDFIIWEIIGNDALNTLALKKGMIPKDRLLYDANLR